MLTALLVWILLQTDSPRQRTRFVETLALVQEFGTANAADPDFDQQLKVAIAKALKDAYVTQDELGDFMNELSFNALSGSDQQLDAAETKAGLSLAQKDRSALHPQLQQHAEYLTTTFDLISDQHREASKKLAQWIAENYRDDRPLGVIVVCTGNSRRSMLGASMGNLAASYYGMNKLRFYSGGTSPTAFNARTIKTLRDIGFVISQLDEEAPRGEPSTSNPKYRVAWGEGLESIEFSKRYSDEINPSAGFAALMVCTEADGDCPVIKGASLRISLPYLDPKLYDGDPVESLKYAERRDDMGRFMLSTIAQAKARTRFSVK